MVFGHIFSPMEPLSNKDIITKIGFTKNGFGTTNLAILPELSITGMASVKACT